MDVLPWSSVPENANEVKGAIKITGLSICHTKESVTQHGTGTRHAYLKGQE